MCNFLLKNDLPDVDVVVGILPREKGKVAGKTAEREEERVCLAPPK